MPSDWSDPETAEWELARREGRALSDTGPQEDDLAAILPAIRRLLERPEAGTANRTRDIAILARIDAKLAAGRKPLSPLYLSWACPCAYMPLPRSLRLARSA